MEENNTPKPNQVMDIQPPKQPEQAPQLANPTAVAGMQPEVQASQPTEEAAPITELNEVQEAPQEQDMDLQNEAPAAISDTPVLAAIAQPKEKHRTPVLAVICAVMISGVFAALAVYAFLGNQKTDDTAPTSQTTQQPTDSSKATAADIDSTNTAIDDSLKTIDDTADYSDDAVSDTTLGL